MSSSDRKRKWSGGEGAANEEVPSVKQLLNLLSQTNYRLFFQRFEYIISHASHLFFAPDSEQNLRMLLRSLFKTDFGDNAKIARDLKKQLIECLFDYCTSNDVKKNSTF